MATTSGRSAGPGRPSTSTERHAARATTAKAVGLGRASTSTAWVPIDPVDPTRLTVSRSSPCSGAPVASRPAVRASPEVEHPDEVERGRQDEEQGVDAVEHAPVARAGSTPCP